MFEPALTERSRNDASPDTELGTTRETDAVRDDRIADLRRRRAEVVDVLAETILDELLGVPRGPVGATKRRSKEPANA